MNEANVIKFVRLLGYDDLEMTIRDNWVNIACPLARSKHASRQDSHPSAGISINPQGSSFFKCFSCTPKPISLLRFVVYKSMENQYKDPTLAFFYQKHEVPFNLDHDLAEDALFAEQIEHVFKFNKWVPVVNPEAKREKECLPQFPEELLKYFPTLADSSDPVALGMKDYLVNVRKASMGVIADTGVRYNKNKNLIIFPLTDFRGRIQVLRARVCDPGDKIMFTISSKQFNNKFNLPTIRDTGASFGLHKIDPTKPTIIVESETDCLLLKSYGFNNVIATTSASFSKSQIQSIPSPNLWVGFDSDDAGKRATKNLIGMTNGKLVHVINWAQAGGKDPGDAETRLDVARAINKKVLVDKKNLTNKKKYVKY